MKLYVVEVSELTIYNAVFSCPIFSNSISSFPENILLQSVRSKNPSLLIALIRILFAVFPAAFLYILYCLSESGSSSPSCKFSSKSSNTISNIDFEFSSSSLTSHQRSISSTLGRF
ncbi:hypothetical protein Q604_UNBC18655G0002 [human gut metagenome]|uniref:Uncharacterized protein n=1 Tax=human gut metagenome TaxID=408170 RepID=W1WJ32_9ZZZZ